MTIVHGQVCYLQVPTTDLAASARFYAAVLGWQTDAGEAGFEAPGVIGQFVTDRAPAPTPAWSCGSRSTTSTRPSARPGRTVAGCSTPRRRTAPPGSSRPSPTRRGTRSGLVSHAGGVQE